MSNNPNDWLLWDLYAPPGGKLRVTVLGEAVFHRPAGTEAAIVIRDTDTGTMRVSIRWPDAQRDSLTIDRIALGVRLGQLEVIG